MLSGAFFRAGHLLIVGWLSPKIVPLKLAFAQFAVCSALSLVAAIAGWMIFGTGTGRLRIDSP